MIPVNAVGSPTRHTATTDSIRTRPTRIKPRRMAMTVPMMNTVPRVPIVANVDAEPKRRARDAIEALVAQVSAPVRWEAVVARLASEGVTTYVEVGPGTVLSGLVRKIQRDAATVSFGSPDTLAAVEAAVGSRAT